MKEPTAEKVLKNTFDHLEKVLREVDSQGDAQAAPQGLSSNAEGRETEREKRSTKKSEELASE